jgi:hypothetical protein
LSAERMGGGVTGIRRMNGWFGMGFDEVECEGERMLKWHNLIYLVSICLTLLTLIIPAFGATLLGPIGFSYTCEQYGTSWYAIRENNTFEGYKCRKSGILRDVDTPRAWVKQHGRGVCIVQSRRV